jgi:hypothetical protein
MLYESHRPKHGFPPGAGPVPLLCAEEAPDWPPNAHEVKQELDDVTAVLEGTPGRWKLVVNLAPRWRLYLGLVGVITLFLTTKFGTSLIDIFNFAYVLIWH